MKTLMIYISLTIFWIVFSTNTSYSQDTTKTKQQTKKPVPGVKHQNKLKSHNFVDKNGDGYNDNAPDDDGDGIPNGLDPDYVKKKDLKDNKNLPFVDLDGDGINDNLQNKGKNKMLTNSHKNIKPQNGTNSGNNSHGKGQNENGKKRGKR